MSMREIDERRNVFTLIELLVVIAIIAILTSILLPSLSKARKTAHKIVCANSLKQLAFVSFNYSQDNNEVPVWTYAPKSVSPLESWGGTYGRFDMMYLALIAPYLRYSIDGLGLDAAAVTDQTTPRRMYWCEAYMNEYDSRYQAYKAANAWDTTSVNMCTGNYAGVYGSYTLTNVFNANNFGNSNFKAYKIFNIKYPSWTGYWVCSKPDSDSATRYATAAPISNIPTATNRAPTLFHGGGNFAHFDGHVQLHPLSSLDIRMYRGGASDGYNGTGQY